jgi:hypothetical protein
MDEDGIHDAEVVDEPGQELERVGPVAVQTNLFRTDDPVLVVQRATEVANALKSVLDTQNLTSNVGGRKHVNVEGWQTVGTMLGIVPVVVWTRPLEGAEQPKGAHSWEARVEARTLDGRIVGAAEAVCSRGEKTWSNREDYALKSMAQTRATSKALKSVLGFVVSLAGYSSTPLEEMADTTETPPYGIVAEEGTQAKAGRAIGYLLGHDAKLSADAWGRIEKDAGYFPLASARAVLHVAAILRASQEPEQDEPPTQEQGAA